MTTNKTSETPKMDTNSQPNPNVRATVIRLATEVAEALEDYRYQEQRRRRSRVTKRSIVEQALLHYFRTQSQGEPS